MRTIDRVNKTFIEEGFEAALERSPLHVSMKAKQMEIWKQN